MNALPKSILNRWSILLLVILISLIGTFVISTRFNNTAPMQKDSSLLPSQEVSPSKSLVQPLTPVKVKLDYNTAEGFIDIYISNPMVVEHGELIFNLSGNSKYTKVEEDTLFERYADSSEVDKVTGARSLRLGASRGIEGSPVSPADNQKFARVYFSSLSKETVTLDTANSQFVAGVDNKIYKIVVE